MPQCCAYGCRNEWGRPNTDKSVRFHKFPKDEELKKKWIQATKWKHWKPSLCSVLCSVHFQEDDLDRSSPFRVYLKKGAVPSIFPAFPKHLQTKTLPKKRKAPEEKILHKQPPTKKAKLVETKWIKFTSTVVSCTKHKLTELNGKKVSLEGYEVVLDDTIFFPEGGGQPCDQGSLNGKRVHQVVRNGDKAVHFVEEPFEVGEKVEAKVDWDRRFDHMQQHSGQHLITAIIDKMFKFATVSWYMGEDDSYIELDTPSITQDQIAEAELEINGRIQSGKKVTVDVYKDIEELTEHVPDEGMRAPRGLPNDHVGYIRVINIEDLESNMCCGTHVENLSQLQVVKLLHAEKSKRKNQTLLHFLVGNRVIGRLQKCLDTEQKLTVLLKNNAIAHVDLVDKLQKNVKQLNKSLQNVTKDLATLEAQKFKNQPPTTPYFILHRSGVAPEFINAFLKEVGTTPTLLCISVGEDKGPGNITLHGDNKDVKSLGSGISELLNGKGFTQGNRFQAKVNNIEKRSKMEELFVKYFQNDST